MENKKIIVINGNGGVGKDTLIERLSHHGMDADTIMNISSITPIKDIFVRSTETLKNCGIDVRQIEKDSKLRKLFSDMKKAYDEYTNLSMNYLFQTVSSFLISDKTIMFVHIREPENIKTFKSIVKDIFHIDAKTILVVRDTNVVWNNSSDDEVANYEYDVVFDNNNKSIKNDGSLFDGTSGIIANEKRFMELIKSL